MAEFIKRDTLQGDEVEAFDALGATHRDAVVQAIADWLDSPDPADPLIDEMFALLAISEPEGWAAKQQFLDHKASLRFSLLTYRSQHLWEPKRLLARTAILTRHWEELALAPAHAEDAAAAESVAVAEAEAASAEPSE